jgi:hypothetical protein
VGARPVDRPRVVHELEPRVVLQEPPEAVRAEVRAREHALGRRVGAHDRLGRVHLAQRRGLQQAGAAVGAAAEVHAHPLRHVVRGRVDRAGAADVLVVAARHGDRLAGVAQVRPRHVAVRLGRRRARAAPPHAERLEDPARDRVVPRRARRGADDLAGGDVHQVVVAVLGAERLGGGEEAGVAQHLGARERRDDPQVVAARDAGAVREQVAHGERARHVRVAQPELGEVLRHAVVPPQLPLVDEHPQRGDGERLRRRGDREHRVLVDAARRAELPNAEAALVDHRVVAHDGDREAGHLPVGHRALDVRVEPGERVLRVLLRRGRPRGERDGGEHEEERSAHVGLAKVCVVTRTAEDAEDAED